MPWVVIPPTILPPKSLPLNTKLARYTMQWQNPQSNGKIHNPMAITTCARSANQATNRQVKTSANARSDMQEWQEDGKTELLPQDHNTTREKRKPQPTHQASLVGCWKNRAGEKTKDSKQQI